MLGMGRYEHANANIEMLLLWGSKYCQKPAKLLRWKLVDVGFAKNQKRVLCTLRLW
jgi:hypothetical protein